MNHRQADMAPAAATTSTATTTSPNYRTGGQTQEMVSPPTSTSADGRTKASLWAFVLLMSFAFGGWLVKRWIVLQRKARIIEERNELKALQEEIAVVDVSSSSYEHLGRRVVGATHLQVGVGLGGSSASEDVGVGRTRGPPLPPGVVAVPGARNRASPTRKMHPAPRRT